MGWSGCIRFLRGEWGASMSFGWFLVPGFSRRFDQRVGSGPWRTLLDRGCHSLAHGPCLETTGCDRRTDRGPGVGGPEKYLDVKNVGAVGRNEFGTDHFAARRARRLEPVNSSVAGI